MAELSDHEEIERLEAALVEVAQHLRRMIGFGMNPTTCPTLFEVIGEREKVAADG